jgi:hypothetical protein
VESMELLHGERGVHGASQRRTWSPWSFSAENVESMELLHGVHINLVKNQVCFAELEIHLELCSK